MIVWILLYVYKNYCGEDEYQKSRRFETLPYIYAKISYNSISNHLHDIVKSTFKEYFDSSDQKAITYDESTHICENDNDNDNNHLKEKSFEAYHNTCNKEITFYLDHRYFSGLFFMILAKQLFNIKPLNVMKETYTPFVTEYYIVKFLIYMYFFQKNNDSIEMIQSKNEMKRENYHFSIKEIEFLKGSRKYRVIYKILNHVYLKLNIKRKLRVMISIAFESSKERYNNVGAIFCFFDGNFDNMVKEIERNKYQAIASNILQRFSNNGKKARNLVDVVLSCGCFEGGSKNINDFYVTYENIADYPVYCISTTYDDDVKCTITWMNK